MPLMILNFNVLFLFFLNAVMKITNPIFLFCCFLLTACSKQSNDDSKTPDNCVISKLSQQGDTTASLAQYAIIKDGINVDSTVFLYNSEKYLVKSIHYFNSVKKDSIGYVIENGNVKSMTYYNEYGYVNYFRNFTYHSNLETKHWMYTKINGDYGYFYYPWLGKPNKNLLKSSSQYSDLEDYTYQFDQNGKIEKIQVTIFGTPNISYSINVGHTCR